MILFSIYCYLRKYWVKQEHLLQFHKRNNELRKVYINKCVLKCDIKICTCYFFNDSINIKNFYPINIKRDEKSYKNILIYYIGYITIKGFKYVKTDSLYPVYLILSKVNGYFEGINKSKYLTQ